VPSPSKCIHRCIGNFFNLTLFALFISPGSCHEFLPPRADPENVFEGTIEGRYVLSESENSIEICLRVKNIFDETLQSTALFVCNLHLALNSDTSYHKTVVLGPLYLLSGNYDSVSHVLTIDPGSSILFRYVWNFIDDSGRDLRQTVFQYTADPSCSFRTIARAEAFTLDGELKVFDHTGTVRFGPVYFTFNHVSSYVDPGTCRPVQTDTPCGLIH